MEKDDSIQLRCSKEMKAKLQKRAKDQGVTLTKLVWLSLMTANPELSQDILAEI